MANSDDSKFRSDVDILTFRYLRPTTVGNMGDWQRRHSDAVHAPRGREYALVAGVRMLVALMLAHRAEGSEAGEDGFGAPYFEDLCKGLRAMLNFECGRLDCGTVDSAILQIATDAKLDSVETW